MEFDSIPALILGSVQGGIGVCEQEVKIWEFLPAKSGNPETRGYCCAALPKLKFFACKSTPNSLNSDFRLILIRMG